MPPVHVGIIAAELESLKPATALLERFNVTYAAHIVKGQISTQSISGFLDQIERRGARVVLVGSKPAQLPGLVAVQTILPVIAVPLAESMAEAVDLTMAVVDVPRGVPLVMTGPNKPENAALVALQILALNDPELTRLIITHRERAKST